MPTPEGIRGAAADLRIVREATAAATCSIEIGDIVRSTADAAVASFHAHRADLWLMRGGRLAHGAAAGAGPSAAPDAGLSIDRIARSGGSSSVPVRELDATSDSPWHELLTQERIVVFGVYTLEAHGQVLGCLTVGWQDEQWAPAQDDALSLFAAQVANALEKALLHDNERHAADAIEMQNRMLCDLAECRDIAAIAASLERHMDTVAVSAEAALAVFASSGDVLVIEPAERGRAGVARHACESELRLLAAASSAGRITPADQHGSGETDSDLPPFGFRRNGPMREVLLHAGGREVGMLLACHDDETDPQQVQAFLELAAPAVAIGLQNALLFDGARARTQQLASVNDLARSVAGATSASDLRLRLATGVQQTFQWARVALYDAELVVGSWAGEPATSRAAEMQLVSAAARRRRTSRSEHSDRTRVAVPMCARGVLWAVLYVEQPDAAGGRCIEDVDITLLEGVVEHAAAAVTALAAYEDLERNYLSTVQALVSALEASDQYTSDHSNDVARWAVEVGRRLGLDEQGLKDLELGAVFHDIGKIAIPNEILNKPAKLTEEEFEVMKTHTVVGERIIAPIEFLQRVRPIVRHEHERWDGRGYPDGISGEQIPLGSRIIFVCDAYHAITSDRPYRQAQSHEVAARVLIENAGAQFDAAVVSVFIDVIEEFRSQSGKAVEADHGVGQVQLPPAFSDVSRRAS